MATIEGEATIIPTKVTDSYAITIREFDAAGKGSDLNVNIPANVTDFKKWNILARAAVLKQTTWNKFTIPQIILSIMYADKLGLDIELGDVYSTDGKPSINAEGRIKLAMGDSRYRGFKTTIRDTGEQLGKQKCVAKTDLECSVEVYVEGWQEPIRRTARLSRWYRDTPAWNERPEHQLELNTLGHACRFLRPVGDPADTGEESLAVAAAK